MRKIALIVGVLLITATTAQAQTHPCDAPEQTVATKGSRIGWCVVADDVNVPQWKLKVSSVLVLVYNNLIPTTGPSANGRYYIEAPLPSGYARGTYPVAVYGTNEYGDGPDSDIKLWQIGGKPTKPEKTRVTGAAGDF